MYSKINIQDLLSFVIDFLKQKQLELENPQTFRGSFVLFFLWNGLKGIINFLPLNSTQL